MFKKIVLSTTMTVEIYNAIVSNIVYLYTELKKKDYPITEYFSVPAYASHDTSPLDIFSMFTSIETCILMIADVVDIPYTGQSWDYHTTGKYEKVFNWILFMNTLYDQLDNMGSVLYYNDEVIQFGGQPVTVG